MAMRLVSGWPEDYTFEGTVTAGVAIATGDILAISGNVLQRATATSSIHTIVGVAAQTITTTGTTIRYIPFVQGQIWDVDTAADTATTQRYESMILSTTALIDNTDTDVTGPTGVFFCLAVVGTAANRRLLGEFTRLQSTST